MRCAEWRTPCEEIAMQIGPEAITQEIGRLQRNYEFLSYGLTVAWLILVGYVLMMMARQRALYREIANLKAMLEEKQR
jgi:hypothetical protein